MRGGAEVIKMWEVKKTGEDVEFVMFVFWHQIADCKSHAVGGWESDSNQILNDFVPRAARITFPTVLYVTASA